LSMSEKCDKISYVQCVLVAVKMQHEMCPSKFSHVLLRLHYYLLRLVYWLSQHSGTRFTKTCLKLPDVLHPLPFLERMRGERLVNETATSS